ncbi:MAG: bifunctional nuclease family protein [Myxococcales bacterium]|nr:bifunctional nuclease family protein [Myxococcales bacterium]
MIRMSVAGVHLDSSSGSAVLVLANPEGRALPILIGLAEATSIARELEGVELPRPLTHDLLRDSLEALGARILRVEVTALRENTYYAIVVLADASGRETQLDSRPSDAVALAVRVDAPIFVHEQVLRETQSNPQEILASAEKEEWKKILEAMDPEDFGKYKM